MIKNISIILFLLATANIYAQPANKHKEKIKVFKVGFITNQLDLSDKEAQAFWPIYNQYEKDRKKLRKNRIKKSDVETMSDQQLSSLLREMIEKQEQVVALRSQLIEQLKPILPLKKIVKLQIAERQFKKEILRHMNKGQKHKKSRDIPKE